MSTIGRKSNRDLVAIVGEEMRHDEENIYAPVYDRINKEVIDYRRTRRCFESIETTTEEKNAWNAIRSVYARQISDIF